MNVTFTNQAGQTETHKALKYAFPKKGNAPEGFHLLINNVKVEAATTGGGKYPKYTYFKHDGASYYLPKNVNPESGTALLLSEEAKPAEAEAPAVYPHPAADAVLAEEAEEKAPAAEEAKPKRSRGKKAE